MGAPDILIGDNIDPSKLHKYFGLIQCRILPPQKLRIPLLPFRTSTGKLMFPLCAQCSQDQRSPCKHSDESRGWDGCYVVAEVQKAVQLGYKVESKFSSLLIYK